MPGVKPRRYTAPMVRNALKAAGRDMTSEELAKAVGCTVRFLETDPVRWAFIAIGYRPVRNAHRRIIGWRYRPQDPTDTWLPATPTIEELEAEVASLKAQVVRLGGEVHADPAPQSRVTRAVSDTLDDSEPADPIDGLLDEPLS